MTRTRHGGCSSVHHAGGRDRGELPGLTGLRGYAALTVVLFHAEIPGFGWGGSAVDVFFALSGYVLAHVYRARLSPGDFLWARFARVGPTHLVATGAYCLAGYLCGSVAASEIVPGMLLVKIVNPPTWSLQIEIIDYLMLAALFPFLMRAVSWQMLLVLGGALGLAGISCVHLGPTLLLDQLARGVGWFIAGMATYRSGWRPSRTRVLDNPVALWLGEISYPLYLIHYMLLGLLISTVGPWLGILASIGAAVVLHHAVETPARRWLRSRAADSKKAGAGSLPAGLSHP